MIGPRTIIASSSEKSELLKLACGKSSTLLIAVLPPTGIAVFWVCPTLITMVRDSKRVTWIFEFSS
jgi:hypothetical protein